MNKNIEQI